MGRVSETFYVERSCPSETCNGQTRQFKVMTATNGVGDVIARVERCTWCGYRPGDIRSKSGGAQLEGKASGASDVIPAPESVAERTTDLEEFGFRVVWYRTPDGLYLVQVFDDDGTLLDGGGGDDPVEAFIEVAARLLPPPLKD